MATSNNNINISSESDQKYVCKQCSRLGNTSEASSYCNVCQEYLCRKCTAYHHNVLPITANHEVVPIKAKMRTFSFGIETNSYADETNYWIYGLAMLLNNKLVAVERYGSTLKLIDTAQHKLISDIKLPSSPVDVEKTSADTVAVALPDKRKIVFFRIVPSLALTGDFKVTGECSGLSFNADRGWLAISFLTPSKVELVDLTGQVIHVIAASKHLFSRADRVMFSHDNKALYVCSNQENMLQPDGKDVVKINLDGKLLACTNMRIFNPSGMVACRNGGVYIAGQITVYFISSDCNHIIETLNLSRSDRDRLGYPSCLQLSEEEDKLYVGSYGRSVISVFKYNVVTSAVLYVNIRY